jgi:hypothetical protein
MKKNKMNVPSIDVIVGDNPVKFIPLKRQLEILNREVSQPDSEGWWWFRENGVKDAEPIKLYKLPDGSYVDCLDGVSIDNLNDGKWVRAIVPDFGGE